MKSLTNRNAVKGANTYRVGYKGQKGRRNAHQLNNRCCPGARGTASSCTASANYNHRWSSLCSRTSRCDGFGLLKICFPKNESTCYWWWSSALIKSTLTITFIIWNRKRLILKINLLLWSQLAWMFHISRWFWYWDKLPRSRWNKPLVQRHRY